jgi:leucyl-tRNA synthetase
MMILTNFISNVENQKKKHLEDIIKHENKKGAEDPLGVRIKDVKEKLLIILSPFAPHMCEELWSQLGNKESIFKIPEDAKEKWPKYDESKVIDSEVEMVVQVNGKVRAKLKLPTDISEEEAKKIALDDENVKKYLVAEPKKVIFVKGKLISIVI